MANLRPTEKGRRIPEAFIVGQSHYHLFFKWRGQGQAGYVPVYSHSATGKEDSKRELISISHQEAMFAPELIHKRVNLTEITEANVYDVLREGKQRWACNWQYLFAF